MKMRKNERTYKRGRHAMRTFAVLGAALFLMWCDPMVSRAEATGTVIPSSVNIRKEPSQSSEVIGSTSGGKEITIKGKVDVSGVTWYQIYVQGDTMGYVRADMVESKGNEDIPTISASAESTASSEGDQNGSEPGGGAQELPQEEMAKQYGAITVASAKVRPDPSTSKNPVESIPSGTQVVVSGKSEGGDGKTWYYVTFTGSDGSEKTGYVRSDLMELGEMLPVEEAPVEEPQEEQPQEPEAAPGDDYELGIETETDGEQVWYIYDHVTGKQQKLVPLLEASYAQTLGNTEDTDTIVKQRIVIVVLAVLLVVFVITVIVMAFKLRDAYYEEYEDDEEEDEEEEEEPEVRRPARREKEAQERQTRRRDSDEEDRAPRRREDGEERRARRREEAESVSRTKSDRSERRRREVSYEDGPDVEEAVRPAKTRKAKNFLLDDDEFEFEFLNMDDKDLK